MSVSFDSALLEKNYYRINLNKIGSAPFIINGKFKKAWDNYITFTTIRPYIPGAHPTTLCNHINLLKSEVEQCFNLRDLVLNRKYHFICYRIKYSDDNRTGVRLAFDQFDQPFFRLENYQRIPAHIVEQCYKFNISDFKKDCISDT